MRSSLSAVALPLAGGLIVGISGPMLEAMSGRVSHAASVTLVAGWMYALVAFISGMVSRSKSAAAVLGFVSLIVTVFAYYLTKATQGDFVAMDFSDPTGRTTSFAWGDFLSMLAIWCIAALILGPVCGVAGYFARTGPYRLAFQLLVPAVILCETSMRLSVEAGSQESLVGATWSVTRALAGVVILLLVCVAATGLFRQRSAQESSPRR
ncbi:DUF6518 family protein [Streptomyces sp. NPDC003006]